ncbi:MAG: RNA-binding S4 domain-containing protein [Vampirovibrionia bacterium]
MRLDKYLKVSRLIKRRTVANEVCNQGRVFVNSKAAKPSTIVKENDDITIEYANKTITAKILVVPTGNVSIQESKDLYEITEHVQYTENT